MARGGPRCPKGGWVEYRDGPWYKMALGNQKKNYYTVPDRACSSVQAERCGSARANTEVRAVFGLRAMHINRDRMIRLSTGL
eukprot:6225719-Prymnesium_polylepis.1